jgi:glycosyltransferase involved in cell wall biosynthesis
VIIPAYGVSDFIGATLDSLMAQSFTDFEILVINDGSPDTVELKRALAPYADRIRYLEQPNKGPGAARNTGLRAARGEFVAFLDGDDSWAPTFLEEQRAYLARAPHVDMVYTNARLVGSTPAAGRTYMDVDPSTGNVTLESLLRGQCKILTSSVVARREVIVCVGMFDETLSYAEDYDLWLRLAQAGARIAYQRRVLAFRRIHDDNLSRDSILMCESVLRVLERVARGRRPLRRAERSALHDAIERVNGELALEYGKRSIVSGEFDAARHALANAIDAYRAWRWRSWKLRFTTLGLKVTPGLMRRAYQLRERYDQFRLRRLHETRAHRV